MANNVQKSEKYPRKMKTNLFSIHYYKYLQYFFILQYCIVYCQLFHSFIFMTLYHSLCVSIMYMCVYIYKMCYIVCFSGKEKMSLRLSFFSPHVHDMMYTHPKGMRKKRAWACLQLAPVKQEGIKKGEEEEKNKRKMPKEKFSSTSFIFGGGNGSKCYFIFRNCDALYFSALFMKV